MTFTGGAGPAGAGSASELFAKPATPHANDDEFEGTIDGSWLFTDVQTSSTLTSTGAVDAYADVQTGLDFRATHDPTDRPSWIVLQGENLHNVQMSKPVTLATNTIIYSRITYRFYRATARADDISVALCLWADAAGVPSNTDNIRYFMSEANFESLTPRAIARENNIGTVDIRLTDANAGPPLGARPKSYEYLAIHKIGSVYHFWIGNPYGGWLWITSRTATFASPLARVGLEFYARGTFVATSHVSPGSPLCACDFIRQIDGQAEFYL